MNFLKRRISNSFKKTYENINKSFDSAEKVVPVAVPEMLSGFNMGLEQFSLVLQVYLCVVSIGKTIAKQKEGLERILESVVAHGRHFVLSVLEDIEIQLKHMDDRDVISIATEIDKIKSLVENMDPNTSNASKDHFADEEIKTSGGETESDGE